MANHPITISWTSRAGFGTALRKAATPLVAIVLCSLIAAGCATQNKDSEQAKARWNAARARVLLGLANDQYEHGNLKDARQTCSDALKLSDQVAGLYVLKAKLDIEQGELKAASDALAAASQLAPGDPEPDYLSGIIAERWQQPEAALLAYQAAISKDGGEPAYLMAAGEVLIGLGRSDEAAGTIEEKLVYFESDPELRDMLGQVYQQLGRHREAADMYRRASVLDPENLGYREREAIALMQAGEVSRSATLLEHLVAEKAYEDRISLHLALAECRLQMGRPDAARADFLRATRIDERNITAWLGVGKAALAGEDLPRTEQAIARAEALRPRDAAAADLALLRGYLRLKQGRVPEAAAEFVRAGRIDREDPMPLVMYGYCLQQMGRREEAMQYYGRALELDPQEPLAHQLLDALVATDAGYLHE